MLALLALEHTSNNATLPSMVVCPPTIIQHWSNEAAKYFPALHMVHAASGVPFYQQLEEMQKAHVVVISYTYLRLNLKALTAVTTPSSPRTAATVHACGCGDTHIVLLTRLVQ